MPRAFNYASVVRYDNLFQVLAGQSLVARNDATVQQVKLSYDYYHVGSKGRYTLQISSVAYLIEIQSRTVHITGDKTQWLTNCYGNNEKFVVFDVQYHNMG